MVEAALGMDDLRLNYRVEGSGPPLLLVHGFGISFNIWKDLAPILRPHFSLVMIQLPGIGDSPMPVDGSDYLGDSVEAIEGVRLALGIEKWNVLGYSTGSRIAEAYVQTHAAAVCELIFLCPLQIDSLKLLTLRFAFWMSRCLPASGTWVLQGWRLKFLISLFGFNLQRDPLAAEWYGEISAQPVSILKATVKLVIPVGRKAFSVPVPSSYIWGKSDIVPARPRRPGLRDHFVEANHAAPVLAAEEVGKAVMTILQR